MTQLNYVADSDFLTQANGFFKDHLIAKHGSWEQVEKKISQYENLETFKEYFERNVCPVMLEELIARRATVTLKSSAHHNKMISGFYPLNRCYVVKKADHSDNDALHFLVNMNYFRDESAETVGLLNELIKLELNV